jgi:AhpD family alkylhydroperoxidase
MSVDYPKHYEKLVGMMGKLGEKIPGAMEGFAKLHKESTKNGVLDSKTKELIALGIGITVRCDGCIAFHIHDALEAGATPEEISETISVAVLMGGGPAVAYGCEALEALEQFQELELV